MSARSTPSGRLLRWRSALVAPLMAAVALGGCKTTTTVTTSSDTSQVDVNRTEGDPHKRAAVRLQLAAGYYQKGQMDVALKEASDAAELDPGLAAAYGLLGLIHMNLDQNDQAERNFRHALQLQPNDPELNNNYGWFLCRTRHERDAMPYFDRAAANHQYSTPAMALQNAGICLMQVGDTTQAEKYLMHALESDATSPVAKYQLSRLYLKTHRIDRAEFYYDLLSRSVEPSAQTLWLGTRIAYAKADRRTQRELSEELRTRYPNSPEVGLLNREAFNE